METKEAKKILQLLQSTDEANLLLGLELYHSQNVVPLVRSLVEEEIGYDCLSNFQNIPSLYTYQGPLNDDTPSVIQTALGEAFMAKRQDMRFKTNVSKRFYSHNVQNLLDWLWVYLKYCQSSSVELLFDYSSDAPILLLKEYLPWSEVASFVEFWGKVCDLIQGNDLTVRNLRFLRRENSSDYLQSRVFGLEGKIQLNAVSFVSVPNQNSDQCTFIQKFSIPITIEELPDGYR